VTRAAASLAAPIAAFAPWAQRRSRNLFANLKPLVDFKRFSGRSTLQRDAAAVKNCLVLVELLFITLVSLPPHPLWLRRQIPFVWIKFADQSVFDSGFSKMRSVGRVLKLRLVSNLTSPGLTAAEALCAGAVEVALEAACPCPTRRLVGWPFPPKESCLSFLARRRELDFK
jgi:hypothetical protein